MKDETREALEALRSALQLDTDLGEDPVQALRALAADADAITARTFEGDPYAALVLADAPGSAELEVAARVSGLVPFATEWWQHTVFYVDQTEDPEGNHRVYVRDEDSLPGLPEFSLPSVAALARGWAQAAGGDTEVAWERLVDDDWEEGPTSGSFVLETMVRGSLSSQWAMAGVGAFMPSRPELADQPLPVGADAPGRTLCLHALRSEVDGSLSLTKRDLLQRTAVDSSGQDPIPRRGNRGK